MIAIYSPSDHDKIRLCGKTTAEAMQAVIAAAKAGVTTLELDALAEKVIVARGAKPSFKMEKDYLFTTCLCVNDAVVHAIPTNRPLEVGDRLGIDLGSYQGGFHTDASWSIIVGSKTSSNLPPPPQLVKFLSVGERALKKAITACRVGNHIGDISAAIQETIEGAGYSCVKQLVGHGVGRMLHEDPEIPCYVRGKIAQTPEIKAGMVLALEAIYNAGSSPVVYDDSGDGWTIVSRDGSVSGLFEHTVIVTARGAEVVTA